MPRSWLTPSLALKLAVAAGLSVAVVELVPRTVDRSGHVPPVRMLLVTATITAAICSVLLFWGLRHESARPAGHLVERQGIGLVHFITGLGE